MPLYRYTAINTHGDRVKDSIEASDQTWATVGRIHEKLLEDKIARMSAMVEPALIVVLGFLVGYVAWGLVAGMLAMYAAAT